MEYKAGLKTVQYNDAKRKNWEGTGQRPLLTNIWYPAVDSAIERDILIGDPDAPLFTAGKAALDAEFASTSERFPLIMLSHGTGGAALHFGWLATYLARHGYIVAGVNHHGNTSLEPYVVEGFLLWWERPQDITAVLDQLHEDPVWGERIDWQRVGAAGFSLGGYTVIALAGGVVSLDAFASFCDSPERDATCDPPPELPDPAAMESLIQLIQEGKPGLPPAYYRHNISHQDSRIKAIFSIAPPLGGAFTVEGLENVSIPVKIVVGAADNLAAPKTNAMRYASLIPQADLEIIPGDVGHYTFLSEATAHGKAMLPMFCEDHPDVDRGEVHHHVREQARLFFDAYVG